MGHRHCGVEIARSVIAQLPMTCPLRSDVEDAAVVSSGIGLHLAIFVEPFLGAVIEGRKTIESRFAKNRCAPYLCIGEGDIVFLKKSGGPVVGVAKVGIPQVHELDDLKLTEIRDRHASEICAEEDAFWDERREKKYATLIPIESAIQFDPVDINKRDRRGWVTYRENHTLL